MATITGPKGLVEAACWYSKLLGIDSYEFTLNIVRRKIEGANAFAFFDPLALEGEIELDPRAKTNIYQILAHEMVHIKQYVTGELFDSSPPMVIWKGQPYTPSSNDKDRAYWEQPWEIEAYGREKGMNYMRMKAKALAAQ